MTPEPAQKIPPPVAATIGASFSGVVRTSANSIGLSGPAAGRNWMGFRANGDYTVTGFSEMPLLPGIAALLLIVGGMLAAWRREGS